MSGYEIPCCPELFKLFERWYWLSSVFARFRRVGQCCFRDEMQVCIHGREYAFNIIILYIVMINKG